MPRLPARMDAALLRLRHPTSGLPTRSLSRRAPWRRSRRKPIWLRIFIWIHVSVFVGWVVLSMSQYGLSPVAAELIEGEPLVALQAWWEEPPCTPGTVSADGACPPSVP